MGICSGSPAKSSNSSPSNTRSYSAGPSTSKTSSSANTTTTGRLSSMGSSNFGQSTGSSGMSVGEQNPHGQILESPNLRIFTFSELRSATRNFKPETVLGEGGFGKVFKGWVDEKTLNPAKSGLGMVVAVKKLNSESMQGLEEWQSEVNFLGRLSHPNLVKLLGYCWEDKELLLVYEFMAKGSLENHLFRRGAAFEPLSWALRLKIAIGAARGLAFLHTSEKQIIYRDFKASNILLDSNYNPKLSDFGLAKNGPTGEDSHVTTRVMGTYGYAAPEYVATARSLNSTLVIPKLDAKSFWKDSSDFTEIFDADWFISSLSKDVKIIKELPKKGGKVIRAPYNMRVPRKCTPRCYINRVLPVLLKKHVVQLSKFDYRLANRLDTDFQKLRCRVNYHALRFTDPIQAMGETLIRRMRARSKHFIALHLRFEPDMLAFSGCYYGGGEKEERELGKIRKRWKTLHINNPDKARRHGRCPLTPEEVGLMLRALGYGNDVHIYVASGEVYGGEDTLAPLKALFPNFHSKETLSSKEELVPFSSFSSRMAALDFIVCDESDAFVTNNNGNMAKILAGRRRYFGHKRTIRPNAKKLYSLFQNHANLTWEVFASKVRTYQRGFMGEPNEVRPGRGEFHENPSTCICEKPEAKKVLESGVHSRAKADSKGRKESLNMSVGDPISKHDTDSRDTDEDGQDTDEDPELPDFDDETPLRADGTSNETMLDYDRFMRSEEPELEEMFSD